MPGDIVGKAYIEISAVGRSLHRDVAQAGRQAGDDYANAFDKELKKSTDKSLNDFRRRLADATMSGDWEGFREEGEKSERTISRVSAELQKMADAGQLTSNQFDDITHSMRQWAKDDSVLIRARNDRLAFQRLADTMGTDIEKVIRTDSWSKYAKDEETASQASKRFAREITNLGKQAGLSKEAISDARAQMDRWAKSMDGADHNALRQEVAFKNLSKVLGGDLRKAIENDNWKGFARDGETANQTVKRLTKTLSTASKDFNLSSQNVQKSRASLNRWAKDVDSSGKKFDTFSRDIQKETDNIARAFRNDLAKALASGDFSHFVKSGDSADLTMRKLSVRLESFGDDLRLTGKDQDTLRKAMDDWSKSSVAGEHNMTALDRAVTKLSRSLGGDLNKAVKDTDWKGFMHEGEDSRQTIVRIDDSLKSLVGRMGMTNSTIERSRKSLRDWGNDVDEDGNKITRFEHDADTSIEAVSRAFRNRLVKSVAQVDFDDFRKKGESAWQTMTRLTNVTRTYADRLELSEGELHRMGATMRLWAHDVDNGTEHARSFGNRLRTTAERTDAFAGSIGRVFGKGARNNFLNLMGRSVEGLVKLGTSFPIKIAEKFGTMLGFVQSQAALVLKGFEEGGLVGGLGALKTAFGTAASGGANLIGGMVALAAVFAIVTVAAGTLAAVLSAVLAAAIGLVGTILVAITGGLLAMVPLLGAAVVGFGLLAAAIVTVAKSKTGFSKLKGDIDKVKASITSLAKNIAPQLTKVASLVISGVNSLIKDFTPAIKGYLDDLYKKLDSPEMSKFMKYWATQLPAVFSAFGAGINSLLAALVAFFKPLIPYAQQLADKFKSAMTNFMKWSQSAKGQNSIESFMKTAWKAGGQLWQVIKNIGGILADVFYSGTKNGGTNFLSWLSKVTGNFKKFLDTPKGNKAMQHFFDNATSFFKSFASGSKDFSKFGKNVDWKSLNKNAAGFAHSVGTIASAIELTVKIGGVVSKMYFSLGDAILYVEKLLPVLGAAFDKVRSIIQKFDLSALISDLISFGSKIGSIVGGWVSGVASSIGSWAAGVTASLVGVFTGAWDALTSWVSGTLWPGITAFFAPVPGLIVDALNTLAVVILLPFALAWNTLSALVMVMINGVIALFQSLPSSVQAVLISIGDIIAAPFQRGWALVTSAVSSGIAWAKSTFATVAPAVKAALSAMGSAISQPFINGWNKAVSAIRSGWNRGVAIFHEVAPAVKAALKVLGTAIAAPFVAGWNKAVSDIRSGWNRGVAIFRQVVGAIRSALGGVGGATTNPFSTGWNKAVSTIRSGWNRGVAVFRSIVGAIRSALGGVAGAVAGPFEQAWRTASSWWSKIKGIVNDIKNLHVPNPFSGLGSVLGKIGLATGGLVAAPTQAIIGEAGPEAVVPLSRPLSQVDPSVRWLSAIAQGKMSTSAVKEPTAAQLKAPLVATQPVHVEMNVSIDDLERMSTFAEFMQMLVDAGNNRVTINSAGYVTR